MVRNKSRTNRPLKKGVSKGLPLSQVARTTGTNSFARKIKADVARQNIRDASVGTRASNTGNAFSTLIERAKASTVRVIVNYHDGTTSFGTGFFATSNTVLTCAHVLLGENVPKLAERFRGEAKPDMKKAFREHFEAKQPQAVIELPNGTEIPAEFVQADFGHDIGIVKVKGAFPSLPSSAHELMLGDDVFFCGFQEIPYATNLKEYPFTVNAGFVSSIYDVIVAGYKKREYIQVNAINLSGNSGGPLMLASTGEVVGIINGNRLYGNDKALIGTQTPTGIAVVPAGIMVPIGIAYATSLNLAKAECGFVSAELKNQAGDVH